MSEGGIADEIVENGRDINQGIFNEEMATISVDDAPLIGDGNQLQIAESQDLRTPGCKDAIKRRLNKWERRLQESHPAVYDKYEKCVQWWKYILGGLFLLVVLLVVFFFASRPSEQPPTPSPELGLCAPSLIPPITYSPANTSGTPKFWEPALFLMPCKSALQFNQAILDQVNTRFEEGTWINRGNESIINSTGGEHMFMQTYLRFAIIASRVTDQSLTYKNLSRHFGNQFQEVKCKNAGIMNILLDRQTSFPYACYEAEFNESLNSTCTTTALRCIRNTEKRVLLFAMALGEYKAEFRFVITRNGTDNSMAEFFTFVDQDDRDEMAQFLNNAKDDFLTRIGTNLNSLFISIVEMMRTSDPKIGQDWISYFEENLHFLYDEKNEKKIEDLLDQ